MIKDETMNISYNLDYTTSQRSRGTNKNKFIMLHHTGGGSFAGMMGYLSKKKNTYASAHYVIGQDGEIGRIGLDNYILWHSGKGEYKGIPKNMGNSYSIGIEVVSDGKKFTVPQIKSLERLVKELQKKHNIENENIIRHKDYAPSRKWDIGDNFFKVMGYNSFDEWKLGLNQTNVNVLDLQRRIGELEKENLILENKNNNLLQKIQSISNIINI